jgi:hypothetical protein
VRPRQARQGDDGNGTGCRDGDTSEAGVIKAGREGLRLGRWGGDVT